MITEATLEAAHLFPELVPDAQFIAIPTSSECTPILLDLRRINNKLVRLVDIGVDTDVDVDLRIRTDDRSLNTNAGILANSPAASAFNSTFDMLAMKGLYYNLFNSNAGVAKPAFSTCFGVWIYPPTVADKLKLGIPLTVQEQELSTKYNIASTVEKGILPLPVWEQVRREYASQLFSIETHARSLTVATTAVPVESVFPVIPGKDFIVLTDLNITPGIAANNIRLDIKRDNNANYVSNLRSLALTNTGGIRCFIPAVTEISLSLISAVALPGMVVNIRYTIWRCKLTNLLRARWKLVPREQLPEPELYDKVLAGLL